MTECKTIKPEPPYFATPEELRGYKEGRINQLEQQIERIKENTKSNKKAFDKLNSKYSHVCNERDALINTDRIRLMEIDRLEALNAFLTVIANDERKDTKPVKKSEWTQVFIFTSTCITAGFFFGIGLLVAGHVTGVI